MVEAPGGSVLFNQFYWAISSVCRGRKAAQLYHVIQTLQKIKKQKQKQKTKQNQSDLFPNPFSQFLCWPQALTGWTRLMNPKFLDL